MDIIITFFFFLDYKFICFFLEGVREGERERNINVWLPLVRPLLGTWPATQARALTGNQPVTLVPFSFFLKRGLKRC